MRLHSMGVAGLALVMLESDEASGDDRSLGRPGPEIHLA